MKCVGICEKLKANLQYIGYRKGILPRYANGQKRCKVCDIFMRFSGSNCPCCGYKMRTKSRYAKKNVHRH